MLRYVDRLSDGGYWTQSLTDTSHWRCILLLHHGSPSRDLQISSAILQGTQIVDMAPKFYIIINPPLFNLFIRVHLSLRLSSSKLPMLSRKILGGVFGHFEPSMRRRRYTCTLQTLAGTRVWHVNFHEPSSWNRARRAGIWRPWRTKLRVVDTSDSMIMPFCQRNESSRFMRATSDIRFSLRFCRNDRPSCMTPWTNINPIISKARTVYSLGQTRWRPQYSVLLKALCSSTLVEKFWLGRPEQKSVVTPSSIFPKKATVYYRYNEVATRRTDIE